MGVRFRASVLALLAFLLAPHAARAEERIERFTSHIRVDPDASIEVSEAIRPYLGLGFETVIVRMPAPYDRETIDRMAEVGERLDR